MTTPAADIERDALNMVSRLMEVKRQNDFGGSLPLTVHDGIQIAALIVALADRVAALEDPEASLRRGLRGLLGDPPAPRCPGGAHQHFAGALADDIIGGGS